MKTEIAENGWICLSCGGSVSPRWDMCPQCCPPEPTKAPKAKRVFMTCEFMTNFELGDVGGYWPNNDVLKIAGRTRLLSLCLTKHGQKSVIITDTRVEEL